MNDNKTVLQIFNSEEFGEIRTAGTPDNPKFCLADVCRSLELDASQVMKRLDGGVVSIHPISDSLGRMQNANFVNEDGLYDVILDSRKPSAKKFRKWITSEVLPSIRKTGEYKIADVPVAPYKRITPADIILDIGTARDAIQNVFAVKDGIALAQATDIIGEFYGHNLSALKKLIPPADHKTGFLNATMIGAKLGGVSAQDVNRMLANFGLQYKDESGWRLTALGKRYAEEYPYTRNGHSGYQIKWSESVVSILH